jgi:hypothetical protein
MLSFRARQHAKNHNPEMNRFFSENKTIHRSLINGYRESLPIVRFQRVRSGYQVAETLGLEPAADPAGWWQSLVCYAVTEAGTSGRPI